MKTFFKTVLSAIIVVVLIVFSQSLPLCVVGGVTLFFIWSGKEVTNENDTTTDRTRYNHD